MNAFEELARIQQLEQFAEGLSSTAKLVGRYRHELACANVPESEAVELVRDWHRMFWEVSFRAGQPKERGT